MAYIKKISFAHVGRNEGCCCDRCGQYIQNIVTVDYADGVRMNYGQDCFDKLCKSSRLTTYGKKVLNKTMKKIANYSEQLAKYVNGEMNAENDAMYQIQQPKDGYWEDGCWTGKPYNEYRNWMISMEEDSMEKLVYLAYYLGRDRESKFMIEKHNCIIGDMYRRAQNSRYYKLAKRIIGQPAYTYFSRIVNLRAHDIVSRFGNDETEL